MKKIASAFILAALLLSLIACSASTPQADTTPTPAPTPTATPEAAPSGAYTFSPREFVTEYSETVAAVSDGFHFCINEMSGAAAGLTATVDFTSEDAIDNIVSLISFYDEDYAIIPFGDVDESGDIYTVMFECLPDYPELLLSFLVTVNPSTEEEDLKFLYETFLSLDEEVVKSQSGYASFEYKNFYYEYSPAVYNAGFNKLAITQCD